MKVKNEYGVEVDFDSAVLMMHDEVREMVHNNLAPCTDQEFFDAYCAAHYDAFGEVWELAKQNPVW